MPTAPHIATPRHRVLGRAFRLAALTALTLATALLGLPMTAHAATTLSGTVLTASGAPAVDVEVTLLARDRAGDPVSEYRAIAWDRTDSTGAYDFAPAYGTYAVLVQPWEETQGVTTWAPSNGAAQAQSYTLTDGTSLTVDVRLHAGTLLSGRVTSPDGTAAPNAQIHLQGPSVEAVDADTEGRWSTRVAAGSWTIRAEAATGVPTAYPGTGTPTAVEATGSGTRTGLDIRLARGHVLQGRVTANGAAVAGATVAADDDAAGIHVSATTGSDGRYLLHVPAGTYLLGAHPEDDTLASTYWAGTSDPAAATLLKITADRASLDLVFGPSSGTTMSGTVRLPSGTPAPEVGVCLQYVSASTVCRASAISDENGRWTVSGLSNGTYRILFTSSSASYAPTFHPSTTDRSKATSFALVDGTPVTGLVSTLTEAARISGSLASSVTERLDVTLERTSDGGTVARTLTGTDGRFTLSPLASGSYRIGLNRGTLQTVYAASFHDGVLESAGAAAATPLALGPGENRTGVTLRPVVGGVLKGRILTPGGVGVPGVAVRAFTRDGRLAARYGFTDGTGRFSVTGLDNGRYTVGLMAPLDQDELLYPWYYDAAGAGRLTASAQAADLVSARVGSTVSLPSDLVLDTVVEPVEGWGMDLISPPTITGRAAVGQRLTASTGTWSTTPTGTETVWFVDGRRVHTGTSYVVKAADIDGYVSARVTVSAVSGDGDHLDGTTWTAGLGPVAPGPPVVVTRAPKLTGTAVVGKKFTVDVGTWGPTGATTSVTWLRNGKPITGASGRTYTLKKADVGTRVSARVLGTLAGSRSAVATTKPSAAVKAASKVAVKATPGTGKVKLAITVTAPGLTAARITGTVTVKASGRTVRAKVKKGKAVVTVTKLKKGKRTVTVKYAGNARAAESTKKVSVRVR